MKRMFAAVALLAALGVLSKLAFKGVPAGDGPRVAAAPDPVVEADSLAAMRDRYRDRPERDKALVERAWSTYRQNAVRIDRTDGLRGLALLEKLDLEAIYLYDHYPREFRTLRDTLGDDSAAELLLHWREYFGLKRADESDRAVLIAEVARLSPSQRRAAAKYPNALPMILAEPSGLVDLIDRLESDPQELSDALVILDFIALDHGASDLRAALRTLDAHGPLAIRAFRTLGMDGFALVSLYGPILDALGDALPMDQAMVLVRVNAEYVDELARSHRPETVAAHLRHVAAAGLVEPVGGSPDGLRLVVEQGTIGEEALRQAGPDAADVVYGDYSDPALRRQAASALAEHGTMALAMLAKYAPDPDFRDILRTYGPQVIPPVARADTGPESLASLRERGASTFSREGLARAVLAMSGDSGQATIRLIKSDGPGRVAALESSEVEFRQFLPLYDLCHLGSVLYGGHAPTRGEMTWALFDGGFVVLDVLSLTAVQPEGVVAAEAARAEVKAAARAAARSMGREAAGAAAEATGKLAGRRGAEAAAEHASRWYAVRAAGGAYQVLRRMPEALPRLSIAQVVDVARPLCAKAGLRLSTFSPVRLMKDGGEFLLTIPPGRGVKYLGVQLAQATVGIVGVRKMEEHLASRRPQDDAR